MRARRTVLSATIALGLFAAPALADGTFVKIGNIRGTATEAQHQGWMQIGNWGMDSKSASFSIWKLKYEGAQKAFWFDRKADATSGALQKALAARTQFSSVTFDVAVRNETFRTTLYSVRIISIETHGNVEKVTLQFDQQRDQTFLPPKQSS